VRLGPPETEVLFNPELLGFMAASYAILGPQLKFPAIVQKKKASRSILA